MSKRSKRKLANLDLDLVAPNRVSERWDVMLGYMQADGDVQVGSRVMAAALALAWPRFRRQKDAPRYGGSVIEYGGKVMDYLLGAGATLSEISDAGAAAFELCVSDLAEDEDAESAEGK